MKVLIRPVKSKHNEEQLKPCKKCLIPTEMCPVIALLIFNIEYDLFPECISVPSIDYIS